MNEPIAIGEMSGQIMPVHYNTIQYNVLYFERVDIHD